MQGRHIFHQKDDAVKMAVIDCKAHTHASPIISHSYAQQVVGGKDHLGRHVGHYEKHHAAGKHISCSAL